MKRFIIIILIAVPFFGFSQFRLDYGANIGASGYLGEIGGKAGRARPFIFDAKIGQTRWSLGGFARYKIMDDVFIRADLNYIRIQGADSLSSNPERFARNLSFRNDVFELLAKGEYTFYKVTDVGRTGRYALSFATYVGAGAGIFYNNPRANLNGTWHNLRELQTEGNKYSAFQFAIPLSLGIHYTIKREHRIGFEISYRLTFTDYIDDASTVYPDTTGMSPIAKVLSSRSEGIASEDGDEESIYPHISNYQNGSPRGNPKGNDTYFTAMFSYSKVIKGKYKSKGLKGRGGLGAYKKRKKRRRTRAKF